MDDLQEEIGKMLRDVFADLDNPFEHLLPPDRPPPGARVSEPSRESEEEDWFPDRRRKAS